MVLKAQTNSQRPDLSTATSYDDYALLNGLVAVCCWILLAERQEWKEGCFSVPLAISKESWSATISATNAEIDGLWLDPMDLFLCFYTVYGIFKMSVYL